MTVSPNIHTSLSDAIECGDLATVERLIRQHPILVNSLEWTPPPLHCAILWNQLSVAELLLDSGADLELADPDRQTTPLRYAIMYCKTELIPMLLSRGGQCRINCRKWINSFTTCDAGSIRQIRTIRGSSRANRI